MFSLINSTPKPKQSWFHESEKSSIKDGNIKSEMHTWVFSQTLENGNRKNEIWQKNEEEKQKRVKMESRVGTK